LRYAKDTAELLAEMDWCGIERALVYHAGMRFNDALAYNARLAGEAGAVDRLAGSWAILPSQTGEFPQPEALLREMQAHGIRALRAFPDEHRYQLDKRTFGELFEALIEHRIPLFVKQNIVSIGGLLAECPGLTVVAMNVGPHSLERYLRPLLDAFPTLYVDTSHYMVDGLIEEFVERYGPERLLFGSGFPDVCSGAALLRLAQAEISETARAAIAGGNLERLLAEVRL
jgi:hypothetical protein